MEIRTTEQRGDRSIGELFSDLSAQTSRLMHDEIRLAQEEMKAQGKAAARGGGMLAGAGAAGFFAFGAFVAAVIAAIALALPVWASALIVGAGLAVVAGVVALLGRSRLQAAMPPVPSEAISSSRRDLEAVKEGLAS